MPAYTPRIVDRELDQLLGALPAIAIEGAKGVGKTATAERRARTSFRLDEPAQAAIASADPSIIVESPPPLHPPTHSGAGRIVSLRMRPLTLAERNLGDSTVSLATLLAGNRLPVTGQTTVGLREYAREIIASGFPGLRHLSGRALRAQLDGYLARIVDRDFLEQGRSVRRPETLQRWLRAYAAARAIRQPEPPWASTGRFSSASGSSIRCRAGCRLETSSRG